MYYQVILVVHVLLGLGVVGLVLIQHGKGADAGAAFGSASSGSVFGAQGASSFLSRTTAILAALFFTTSLGLAVLSGVQEGEVDLMDGADSEQVIPDLPLINGGDLEQTVDDSMPVIQGDVPTALEEAIKSAAESVQQASEDTAETVDNSIQDATSTLENVDEAQQIVTDEFAPVTDQ